MRGGPVIPGGGPLMYPQHVGSARPEEPLQAGQAVHQDGAEPRAQPGARGGQVSNVTARGEQHLVRPRGRPWDLRPPLRAAGDHQLLVGIPAEPAIGGRQLGPGDGRDVTEGHDLAVRVFDRGADRPAAVLEHEHVAHVAARPERGRARGPQLDHPGRPARAQRRERAMVVRAVQDHLMTPAGQGGPAVGNVQDVVGPGRLEPARAERAQAIRLVRPVLPPRGDDDAGARQRVDTQVSLAHGPPRAVGPTIQGRRRD